MEFQRLQSKNILLNSPGFNHLISFVPRFPRPGDRMGNFLLSVRNWEASPFFSFKLWPKSMFKDWNRQCIYEAPQSHEFAISTSSS